MNRNLGTATAFRPHQTRIKLTVPLDQFRKFTVVILSEEFKLVIQLS